MPTVILIGHRLCSVPDCAQGYSIWMRWWPLAQYGWLTIRSAVSFCGPFYAAGYYSANNKSSYATSWVLACECNLSIEESRKRETFWLLNMYFAIFSEFPNLQWHIFRSVEVWTSFQRTDIFSLSHLCFVWKTYWCGNGEHMLPRYGLLPLILVVLHTSERIKKKILKRWYVIILKYIVGKWFFFLATDGNL